MTMLHYHVFIPGLFAPLRLWHKDFAFQPESAALLRLLADYESQSIPVKGLQRSLLHWLGLDVQQHLPWSQLRHAFESGGMYQPPLLCADPVYLQSGSNAVTMHSEPPMLTREETERLLADLNQHLEQDSLVLKAFHPQRWYLHALDERFSHALPATTPMPEVGPGNIFQALPQSEDKYWHQLLNELQMLLHNHAVNQAREQSGQLPVNGVWLWGEDRFAAENTKLNVPESTRLLPVASVQGGGLSGEVIASVAKARWQPEAVASSDAGAMTVSEESSNILVILDQLQSAVAAEQPQAWQHALAELDGYFAFLQDMLQAGSAVSVYDCAGRILHCQKVAGWQFWRKQSASWDEFIT